MTVTIDIPESMVDEAKARGISVEALVRERIETSDPSKGKFASLRRWGSGKKTPTEAGIDIMDLRKGASLDGITITELIEQGRRY